MFVQITNPITPLENADALATAISRRRVEGTFLIASVGEVTDRSAVAQAADYLLNLGGVLTCVVYGIVGEKIYVSARTKDSGINVAKLMEDAFGNTPGGGGGGHAMSAGATIPLGLFSDIAKDHAEDLIELMDDAIAKRINMAMQRDAEVGRQ